MITRLAPTAAVLVLSAIAAERAAAQAAPADVTFSVPVNLTRLPVAIPKIKVGCVVNSSAIVAGYGASKPAGRRNGDVELPVTQGEIVQTAQVVVPVTAQDLDDPSGKQATYECRMFAFRQSHGNWQDLHSAHAGDPVFTLTPWLAPITGSFVW